MTAPVDPVARLLLEDAQRAAFRAGGAAYEMRLLTAHEMLQCDSRAAGLFAARGGDRDRCDSAALAFYALWRDGARAFPSAGAAQEALGARGLRRFVAAYAALSARGGSFYGCDLAALRDNLRRRPEERVKWAVLRAFHRLPSSPEARAMTQGELLYCYANLLLDAEADEHSANERLLFPGE